MNVPMHQHPATPLQALLKKGIADRKPPQHIFLIHVVNLHRRILKVAIGAACRIDRRAQGGENMGDVSLAKGVGLLGRWEAAGVGGKRLVKDEIVRNLLFFPSRRMSLGNKGQRNREMTGQVGQVGQVGQAGQGIRAG